MSRPALPLRPHHRRSGLATVPTVLALAAALLVAAVPGASAEQGDEADPVTVSVRVVDADGQPVPGIDIALVDADDGLLGLGATDAEGALSTSRYQPLFGDPQPIPEGDFAVLAQDGDPARDEAGTRYLDTRTAPTTLVPGDNEVGPLTVRRSARITGRVTAPSGRPVRDLGLLLRHRTRDDVLARTSAKGTFVLGNLAPATYTLLRDEGPADEWPSVRVGKITVERHGQTLTTTALEGVKVACDRREIRTTSSKPGQVKVLIRAGAPAAGLANPLGMVTLKRGSTVLKRFRASAGALTTTLTGQTAGKATYRAVYTGGDCLDWTEQSTVSVKR